MNIEENRLRTFADWPTNAAVDAGRIAKAGFYYTGQALEVQCFLCGIRISEWNYGDQAMARHRQAEPSCPFVVNPSITCNIPILPSDSVLPSSSSSAPLASSSMVESSDVIENRSVVQSQDPQKEYRTMAQRLRSFAQWPIPSVVSPERLAKAGFYYLQQADMVECAFCRGVVMKWEPGDDPDREHRIHFPNCDFYMREDMEDDQLELNNVKLMPGTSPDLRELGIQTHSAPRKPKHATYEGRLRTFQGWPENMKQTPEMLSSAGFYYVGSGDQVRCFHCDGGLRNWEATDDAWIEHAKWFPRCGYVNLVRGQEFVKQCVDNRPPLDPSIFSGIPEDESGNETGTPPASLSMVAPPTQEVTDSMIERLLNSAPAMSTLEIGLHIVNRAKKKRMEQMVMEQMMMEQTMMGQMAMEQISDDNNTSETDDQPEIRSETNTDQPECESSTQKSDISDKESGVVEKKTNAKPETLSLEEEIRRLKEARLCKICMDREVAIVFLPCGHLATCVLCAPSLTYCPMCRQEIRATVRTFLS